MTTRTKWFQGRADVAVFSSIDELIHNFPQKTTYISVVKEEAEPLDFYWDYRGADRTIVLFHASLGDTVARLPVFLGLSASSGVKANRLFIADPAHYASDEVIIGWFLGTKNWPHYQKHLIDLFGVVNRDYSPSGMVFFGPSAGGYASLYYSSHIPSSIALPINPQTNLTIRSAREIRPLCSSGWGIDPELYDPFRLVPAVKEIVSIYAQPTSNVVLYVQNSEDRVHVRDHYLPFKEALNASNSYLEVLRPWGRGHIAPPKDFTTALLNAISEARTVSQIQEVIVSDSLMRS